MKIKHYLLVIVTFALALSVTGCSGPTASNTVTLETEYDSGNPGPFQGFGQGMVDPNVNLTVTYDTSSDFCSSQGPNLYSSNDGSSGEARFTGSCHLLEITVVRQGSPNCNTPGAFTYYPFDTQGGTSYTLPCGDPTVDLTISPVSAASNLIPAEIQMTANPGNFVSTLGMPQVSYTNDTGIWLGTVAADSIAPDGSWITFPTTPLFNQYNNAIPGPYIVFAYNIGIQAQVTGGSSLGGNIINQPGNPVPVGGAVFTVDPLALPVPCPASSAAGGASCAPCPRVDLTGNEDCNQPCPEIFIIGGEGGCNLPTSPGPLSFLEPKVPFDFKPDTSVASRSS
jgi:hypothetical protein